ncbi:phospholipase A2 inhibitor and Ly6/PLAUR domain-containing protein-like [Hyperolius riggenbachi]|uniref:phospholipase A2 inhibitor and Ly6/PLAUR domain-containing protein-like n=1 Tax=Hyperolius riggenbachi TaxID=752182 RepID=UPI0035A2BF8A
MSSLFGILCIFVALVASGHSLSCTVCTSETTSSCTGPSMTCPSGAVCGLGYTLDTFGTKTYSRACIPEKNCSMIGSITFNEANIRVAYSCCYTDNCTPPLPTLPERNSTSNGVTCRSCITATSTWCYTSDTIACTGNENMCLLQTTKITGPIKVSTAVRGCSTKSVCDLGSESSSANGVSVEYKHICTSGGLTLQKGFFLPVVMFLVLSKLF